jgi:hypothetical protein
MCRGLALVAGATSVFIGYNSGLRGTSFSFLLHLWFLVFALVRLNMASA